MKPTDNNALSRREFARRAALGTAAIVAPATLPPVLPSEPMSPPPSARSDPFSPLATRHSPLSESQQPPEAAKLSPQSRAEAEARHQAILALYPDRFSDAQKADLQRLCFVLQPQLDSLRAWTVANSDQPALYLKPLVEREKKTNAPPNLKSAPSSSGKSAQPSADKPAPSDAKSTPSSAGQSPSTSAKPKAAPAKPSTSEQP